MIIKKKLIVFLLFIGCLFIIEPVHAKSVNTSSKVSLFENSIYILEDEDDEEFHGISGVEESGIDMDQYNKNQNCESLLGNPADEDSVAWLLQKILNIAKIVGPLLVVVLSSIDFAKVIITSDDDAMTKAGRKLAIRLVLAATLFFIPTLVIALLDVFGLTTDPSCGIQ